jgi:hypothetical protein
MFASHLSDGPQAFAAVVNLVCASLALVASVWAARHCPADWRARFWVQTFLAFVYVALYSWLIVEHDRAYWSSVAIGVGPVAWVAVWIWPAVKAGRMWRELKP